MGLAKSIWTATSLGLILGCTGEVRADEAAEATPDELVQQLGSADFGQRQAGYQQLARMGSEAYEAVADGAQHPDPEIRERCVRLLEEFRRADRRLLLSRLQRGDPSEQTVPGWQQFSELVGDSPALRAFFVQMLAKEWEFIEYVVEHPKEGVDAIQYRLELLKQKGNSEDEANVPSIAALYFATLLVEKPSDSVLTGIWIMCYYRGFQETMRRSSGQSPLPQLMSAWVREVQCGPKVQTHVLRVSLDFGIAEGLPRAREIAEQRVSPPHVLLLAILVINRFGSTEDLPLLTSLFDDARRLNASQQRPPGQRSDRARATEVRDVALYAAILLVHENPRDYGFPSGRSLGTTSLNIDSIGFSSGEQRRAAFEKWEQSHGPPLADPP